MSWGETIFLKNFIKGEKVFIGAKDVSLRVLDEDIQVGSESEPSIVTCKFVPKLSGTVYIKVTPIRIGTNYTAQPYIVSIYKNSLDNIIRSMTSKTPVVNEPLYCPINVDDDNEYIITLHKTSGGLTASVSVQVEVNGMVVDSNYFSVVEE